MVIKKIYITILFNCLLFSNSGTVNPFLKSVFFPGLGQLELGEKKRSKTFILIEVSLLSTCLGSYYFYNKQIKNYKSFSAYHAGVKINDKNHKYWVDIGNYLNHIDYNQEHLRFRESEDLYLSDYQWSWDSDINRNKFKRMRIKADIMKRRINFVAGAIIINHIISSIDVHYLNGLKNKTSLYIDPHSKDLYFKYEF
tara:strand:+ start:3794 stop:4384 length:591 start_codon:yes stop_codon:yes gene_type:complete